MKTTWCVLTCSMFLAAGLAAPLAAQPPADEGKLKAPLKKSKPTEEGSNGIKVGTAAPAFTLKDGEGKEHKLSDYNGKVVLIDFWGTWCPPCRAATPKIQALHEKHAAAGKLQVLGISCQEREEKKPVEYMKEHKYSYQLLVNGDSTARAYKVTGFPTFVVIGADGKVVYSGVGIPPEWDTKLSAAIDKAIASIPSKPAEKKPADKKPADKPEGEKKPEGKPGEKPADAPADKPSDKPN